MIVTRAVSPRTNGRASLEAHSPGAVHRQPRHLDTLTLEQLTRPGRGGVLDGRGDDVPARGRAPSTPRIARLLASVPPEVKMISSGSQHEERGDLLAGPLDGVPRAR